jgi:hypothetical protein
VKLGIKGMYLDLIMAKYHQPIATIILHGEKTENVLCKVRIKERVFTLSTLIQHSLGIPNLSNKTE